MVADPYKQGTAKSSQVDVLRTQRILKSILQRRRGTTKWWLRRARRETLLAVACKRKLVLPLLLPIHTAPTTLLIRHSLKLVPPSPLGKAMVSLRYYPSTCHFERSIKKGRQFAKQIWLPPPKIIALLYSVC